MAYNVAHDVALPGSRGAKLGFFMYPQAETGGERVDSLDPDTFKYKITAREITALTRCAGRVTATRSASYRRRRDAFDGCVRGRRRANAQAASAASGCRGFVSSPASARTVRRCARRSGTSAPRPSRFRTRDCRWRRSRQACAASTTSAPGRARPPMRRSTIRRWCGSQRRESCATRACRPTASRLRSRRTPRRAHARAEAPAQPVVVRREPRAWFAGSALTVRGTLRRQRATMRACSGRKTFRLGRAAPPAA